MTHLQPKDAGYSDSTPEAIKAKGDDLRVISISESNTDGSQEWGPGVLCDSYNRTHKEAETVTHAHKK